MPTGKLASEPRRMDCEHENTRLLEEFLKDLRVAARSEHTIASYRFAIKDFLDFILGLDVSQATHKEVREWLHFLTVQRKSSGTISYRKYALGSFFLFLQRLGKVKDSPTRLVANRKVTRKLPHVLSVDNVDRLIASAKNLRDTTLLEVMYATGCRVSEITGMRIEEIDFTGETVKVIGKGEKDRIVPLTGRAVQSLLEYLRGRTQGFVFIAEPTIQLGGVSRDKWGTWRGYWREESEGGKRVMRSVRLGDYELRTKAEAEEALNRHLAKVSPASRAASEKPITTRTIRRILDEAARYAGISCRVHPHMLRHAFATHLLDGGADCRVIQELLGHENIQTTQIYMHVATRQLRGAIQKHHPHGGNQ